MLYVLSMVTSKKTQREYAKENNPPQKGISVFFLKKKSKYKGKKETNEPKIIKTTHKSKFLRPLL